MSEADLQHEESGHPGPSQYVKIAVVLALITLAEIAIYYIPALASLLIPLLVAFSFAKFMLVILWFMHLRFDSRIFTRLFAAGLLLTLTVFILMLLTFFLRGGPAPTPPGIT
ncbi:MAG: cytochrome C oxidase subunit IV family protein [Actinobacteria bacterium]|jgi:cytochrome c oxidase subunit 4|nr:cytochrome C oxidase subunit IV family protein [Actinomycetota bacterium]